MTQFNEIASIANSFPIVGRAIFTDETSNGVRNAAKVVIKSATLFETAFRGITFLGYLFSCD